MKELGISFANADHFYFLAIWVGFVILYLFNRRWRKINLQKLQVLSWPGAFVKPKARRIKSFFQITGLLFLIIALLGPQWGQKEKPLRAQGLDLCVGLDLSRSMLAEDVAPNRLQAAKNQLSLFIQRLGGDRVTLVGFAGSSFMAVPLTNDHRAIISFMDPMNNSYISDQSTNLPRAVDSCLNALGLEKVKDRIEIEDLAAKVIVLVTDGEETNDDYKDAVSRATKLGVPIYSFAAGTAKGGLIPLRSDRGVEYLKDPAQPGSNVISRLEEKTLKDMADKTGAKVFYLANGVEAWKEFEETLARYKRDGIDTGTQFDREDRFQWPLWIAFFFLILDFLVPELGWRRIFSSSMSLLIWILLPASFLSQKIEAQSLSPKNLFTPESSPAIVYKNNKGTKEFQKRNHAEARKQFEEALSESSQSPVLRFNWASNRLVMSFPQDSGKGPMDPKKLNQQVLDEGLKELQKLHETYLPTQSDDRFYKGLNYQLAVAYELKQDKAKALKHYYTALNLKPEDNKLDPLTEEAIKRLLASSEQGGGGGGEGQDPKENKEGEGEGEDKKDNPQYTRGQQQAPKFDGTEIDDQQAKKILESSQTKENDVRKKNAQKESRAQSSNDKDANDQLGRGKQW